MLQSFSVIDSLLQSSLSAAWTLCRHRQGPKQNKISEHNKAFSDQLSELRNTYIHGGRA